MGQVRANRGFVARETLLALLVLALTFLNFGHAAISVGGEFKLTPDVWCGDPLLPDQPNHSPCHACRIGGGADLPPAPLCAEPIAFAVTPIVYAETGIALSAAPRRLTANPRAPPIA